MTLPRIQPELIDILHDKIRKEDRNEDEMNREMVEKIYKNSVSDSIDNALDDDNETQAWLWEENMVKNSILELKYALSINHHALSLDQLAIIKDGFGDIV